MSPRSIHGPTVLEEAIKAEVEKACAHCGALAGEKCREGCQCGEAVGCETDEQLREMGERYEDWKQGEIDAIRQDGLS